MRIPTTAMAIVVTLSMALSGLTQTAVARPATAPTVLDSAQSRVDYLQEEGDGSFVWVPEYVQQRNLSCEYAASVIAMAAYGVWISEYEFDGLIGPSENPHWGYRGDITGWWGNTDDYGIYAAALVPAIQAFGFWAGEFYALGDASALTRRIDAGAPVIVWLGLWGDTSFYNWTEDGARYKLASGMHVVVAYGYDDYGVWVSDPATGSKYQYDWSTFMSYWNVLDGMALSVGPN